MGRETMPREGESGRTLFDRIADAVATVTARAWFFAACVLLVVLWAPSIVIVQNLDTYQLLINTPTTIITFLLVGLMQNTSSRENAATQKKLNALSGAVLVLMGLLGCQDRDEVEELRTAIGLEHEEST